MKYLLSLLLFTFVCSLPVFAQDTSYLYFNKSWLECNKDTAHYYGIVYKKDGLWSRKDFWVKGNQIQMEASYVDKECKTGQGTFKWYNENGTLKSTAEYQNGKRKSAEFYYESGKKKGHIDYVAGRTEQKGWNEKGEEIPNYIIEKEAEFPGGSEGWRNYLETNLKANVAPRSKAGTYRVKVQFIVDKEGNVSNVQTIEVPDACQRCGKEAVRIIKKGPKWEPAVQDNERVIFQAIQFVTFQVAEE